MGGTFCAESVEGTARDLVSVACTAGANTVAGVENAPWIDDEENWEITEAQAHELRPGWWCHAQDQMRFVEVRGVTLVPGTRSRMVFADLADGRTLALDEHASVWVRRGAL